MVKIIGFQEPAAGKTHNRLILQGEIELISSQQKQGQFYATIQECTIACTFNKVLCEGLIGKTLPGAIEKMECLPYEFQAPGSNEVLILNYNYYYSPNPRTIEQVIFEENAASVHTSNAA